MPGLRGALSIRVSDGQSDRIVSRHCSGLKFTKVAPGGHQSISFTMSLPRITFSDLGPADRAYVYDARTGRTVIEGYLENPTPVDGRDGQQYDISAVGGMARASDEARALIYLTQDLSAFEKDTQSFAAANIEAGPWVTTPTLNRVRVTIPGGTVVSTGGIAGAGDYVFDRAAMNLGAVRIGQYDSGRIDANYVEDMATPSGIVFSRSMSTGATNYIAWVGDTNFPTGTRRFALRLRRTGAAGNVTDDTTWTDFIDLYLLGQRMDRFGTLLVGSAGLGSATQVRASQVVEDLLGRLLTFCDPGTAQVDATTFGITQLAWPDGIKAADVLSQLSVFESDYLWEILETGDNDKHRFNYRAWPTTARYEISTRDGFQQKGSDVDLCNRILVTWTDAAGATQVTPVTATSLGLTDPLPGRIKDADPVSLPDGFGSADNAIRVGGQILTDKINPPKAATAVVRRPIRDLLAGCDAMPWEIEPGFVVRVRETGDELRLTQVDYDDDSCSATLTLGRPVLTEEQRLARLDRAARTLLPVI